MKFAVSARLRVLWISLRTSFWFVPALMAAGGLGLAALMIHLDRTLGDLEVEAYPKLLGANAGGARSILSAIAGSMITVAGVTFSVTIVALSLASNQYTPRILRNFMSDAGNQVVLGAFVSVFIYSLVVLRAIRGGEEEFIPSYSLLVGILLGILAIGFLIYFVHHIATMVQASTILANIYEETLEVINALYPVRNGGVESTGGAPFEARLGGSAEVLSARTGYIQDVDEAVLINWAEKNDATLEMVVGIGEFITAGAPLLRVHGGPANAAAPCHELSKCFGIARYRTIHQDPAFGLRQMVDVALKALSPGVNDTTTAASCVDYLGAILFELGKRDLPPAERCKGGRVRLIACDATFKSLTDLAFQEIRQHARGNISIYMKLLSTIQKVSNAASTSRNIQILWDHARSIAETAEMETRSTSDRRLVNQSLEETGKALGGDFKGLLLSDRPFQDPDPGPAQAL